MFYPIFTCFSPYLGIGRAGGGVLPRDWYTRYVKHVLGRIYVFFTLSGYWVWGGGVFERDWYTTCFCSSSPWAAQKLKFPKLIFLIL